MKYYRIRTSLNERIMGKIPQIKDIHYNCNIWEDPMFIDRILLKKVDFEPIVANPILFSKSKKTDLIETNSIGFQFKLLVSDKMKKIFQVQSDNFQLFKNNIYHGEFLDETYWIINPIKSSLEIVDFSKSEVFEMKNTTKKENKLFITSFEDYISESKKIEKKGYPYSILITQLFLKNNLIEDLVFINNIEGGAGYFVSEKLKQEIEDSGCTGIEFQPAELSYNEWIERDGPRDQIYGRSW